MKYLKQFEELTGKYKDETVIIYKDKNVVCLLPKSQMTSSIYGKKTNWCQTTKPGFEMWSGKMTGRLGLFIRFLFKNGRKVRFTYFDNDEYYWSNETGFHVLSGKGNPFTPTPPKDKIRQVESDILDSIKELPEECKNDVIEFIDKNKKDFKYIYKDKEYNNAKLQSKIDEFDEVKRKYSEDIHKLNSESLFSIYFDKPNQIFEITYSEDSSKYETERFDTIKEFESRLSELINKFKK